MTKQLSAVALGAVLAIGLTSWLGSAQADEPKGSPNPETLLKTLAEASRPGLEHKNLEPLVGEWTYTGKFWLDPNQPATEVNGTIKREWILGNRFIEEHVAGKGPGGLDFEGCGVMGYDKPQGKYTCGWISTMGTGISTGLGTYDEDAKQFTFNTEGYCPLRKATIEGRDKVRYESADKHVFEMYELKDGKEVKVMELTAVRKDGARAAERPTSPIR